MPPTKKNPFLKRRRKKSKRAATGSSFARLPREVLQEYGRRGAQRLKDLNKLHVFTDEEREISKRKRQGTLPPDSPYLYSIDERARAAKMLKRAEELKQFLAERAKMFGRDKNLPKGLNRANEKDPTQDAYDAPEVKQDSDEV